MKTTASQKQMFPITAMLLYLALFVNAKCFGQTIDAGFVQTEFTNVTVQTAIAADADASNGTMNIVSWFMGSKQTPKATISNDGPVSARKQMINAGIAPNRLLVKAFGKKAANYQTTIA